MVLNEPPTYKLPAPSTPKRLPLRLQRQKRLYTPPVAADTFPKLSPFAHPPRLVKSRLHKASGAVKFYAFNAVIC